MKIGVSFPQDNTMLDPAFVRDYAQAVDDLGFDYLTAADHVRSIHLFTEKNPQPNVIGVALGPRAGRARIATRARIAGAVAGIQNFDLGMGPPITFADGRNQGAEAIYYTTVEGGRFVPIRDWKEWAK